MKKSITKKKKTTFKLGKKAFTLTELIAVVVILFILVTLSIVIFINVRKSVLEKEYNNLVFYLETKASEYAEKTGVTTISGEDLIKEGYVKPDDETDIYDPRDKTSMNCYLIKSEYKDGVYTSELGENLGRENGVCKKYERKTLYDICKVVDNKCVALENKWINENITLGISYEGQLLTGEDIKYNWSTNTGFSSNESVVKTNIELVGNVNYKCEITRDNTNGIASRNIQIDMEAPVINEIKFDSNWSYEKNIEIMASDGMGSGINGYSVVESNLSCDKFDSSKNVIVNKIGTYKVCVKDVVGNISEEKIIKVDKIDEDGPRIKAKNAENQIFVNENYVVSSYFEVKYSKSGGTLSCNYEKTGNLTVGEYTLTCTAVGGNGKTASASTKLKVVPRVPSTPLIETKYENNNGEIYNGVWTNKSIYIKIAPGSANDLVTQFQYKIGNGRWIVLSAQIINGNSANFVYEKDINSIIYVRACYESKCSGSSVGKTLKIDKTAPKCSLSLSGSKIVFGSKDSDVSNSGISSSTTESYTNQTLSISTGTYYGYVKDAAGNTGSCKITITTTDEDESCQEVCTPATETCDLVCYYNASSSEIASKSCKYGVYEPTWKTCYDYYYKTCPSRFPNIDKTASRCVTTGGGCYNDCSTTYSCPWGYSKYNNRYCYK